MNQGFVPLPRQWLEVYQPKPYQQVFTEAEAMLDLFSQAAFQDQVILFRHINMRIILKRGEFIFCGQSLAKRWQWEIGKVKRFRNNLAQMELIRVNEYLTIQLPNGTTEKRPNGRTNPRVIFLNGYNTLEYNDDYQPNSKRPSDTPNNSPNTEPPTNHVPINNNKEKQITLEKDIDVPEWIEPELFKAFLAHRKKIRKPMTDNAIKLLIGQLEKFMLNGENPNTILENSIINGWQGVFSIKEKNNGASGKRTQTEILAEQVANIQ